jgi:hypothetical protein
MCVPRGISVPAKIVQNSKWVLSWKHIVLDLEHWKLFTFDLDESSACLYGRFFWSVGEEQVPTQQQIIFRISYKKKRIPESFGQTDVCGTSRCLWYYMFNQENFDITVFPQVFLLHVIFDWYFPCILRITFRDNCGEWVKDKIVASRACCKFTARWKLLLQRDLVCKTVLEVDWNSSERSMKTVSQVDWESTGRSI